LDAGLSKRKVKHKATSVLVRMGKKLKNMRIVSGTDATLLTIIR